MNDENPKNRRAAVGMAILRMWCGLWFLVVVYPKLPLSGLENWEFPAQLGQTVPDFIQFGAYSWYAPVLETLVRYPRGVSWLIVIGETGIALALFFGFFTRTASVFGIFAGLNYLFATGRFHRAYVALGLWIIMALVAVILGRGGDHYGIDALFSGDRSLH